MPRWYNLNCSVVESGEEGVNSKITKGILGKMSN